MLMKYFLLLSSEIHILLFLYHITICYQAKDFIPKYV